MPRLILALDALPALRNAAALDASGLTEAATLAQLAGVEALRLGLGEDLEPVREADVAELRSTAREFELRMPAHSPLLKVALEARPDRVVLCSGGREGPGTALPADLRARDAWVVPVLRSLEEAGIFVAAVVAPNLEAVKAAHGLGIRAVELFTGATVDLPTAERRQELESLGDAARLAAKLRLEVGIGGGLDYTRVREVLAAAPACERVACGRALVTRALLVGLDRAVRDFRSLLD